MQEHLAALHRGFVVLDEGEGDFFVKARLALCLRPIDDPGIDLLLRGHSVDSSAWTSTLRALKP
jgi:hypothetical protein